MIGREKAMQDPRFGDPRWSPAGFVFIATDRDIDEQLKTLLFGYPQSGWGIVKKIVKGTPIFLFDLHHQVQCKYHYKFPPTPRWMFQKVPGLFFDGTLRIDRLLCEEQVQKMYDIFNTYNAKMMRHLAVATSSMPMPPLGLPLPPGIAGAQQMMAEGADAWRDDGYGGGAYPLNPDMFGQSWGFGKDGSESVLPPKGPKPFGLLHTTWSNLHKQKYKAVPHHYTQRPTPYNTKPKKLHDRADDGRNTTVMLANIPTGLTADQCVDSLDRAGFFAMYDYLKFVPTAFVFKSPRFGSLILNMTSREAAEAVFDEVDRITASWPPFDYPYPQVPVRWAKVQGLQELYPAHGDFAFHLDGLPGSWAIPDETHVFFTLPEDPHAERERQRMQARSRAQPDNRMWADAYACGLEAGLDDEIEGPAASGQREAAAWQGLPPGGFHPQHMDPHWNEMAPQQGGMDPDSQPLALPLPPPRSQAPPRGVHLKRPLPNSQTEEGIKRQKTSFTGKPRAVPITLASDSKTRPVKPTAAKPLAVPAFPTKDHKTYFGQAKPSEKHSGKHSAPAAGPMQRHLTEQRRKDDIERRLNSALSSNRVPAPVKQAKPAQASLSSQKTQTQAAKSQAAQPSSRPGQSVKKTSVGAPQNTSAEPQKIRRPNPKPLAGLADGKMNSTAADPSSEQPLGSSRSSQEEACFFSATLREAGRVRETCEAGELGILQAGTGEGSGTLGLDSVASRHLSPAQTDSSRAVPSNDEPSDAAAKIGQEACAQPTGATDSVSEHAEAPCAREPEVSRTLPAGPKAQGPAHASRREALHQDSDLQQQQQQTEADTDEGEAAGEVMRTEGILTVIEDIPNAENGFKAAPDFNFGASFIPLF